MAIGHFRQFLFIYVPPLLKVEGSNHKVVKKQSKEGPRNFPESSHQNGSFGVSQHIVTCCSHGAPPESQLTDTPCFCHLSQTWKIPSLEILFWSFLAETKWDQALPSPWENVAPQNSILVLGIFGLHHNFVSNFFETPCTEIILTNIIIILYYVTLSSYIIYHHILYYITLSSLSSSSSCTFPSSRYSRLWEILDFLPLLLSQCLCLASLVCFWILDPEGELAPFHGGLPSKF